MPKPTRGEWGVLALAVAMYVLVLCQSLGTTLCRYDVPSHLIDYGKSANIYCSYHGFIYFFVGSAKIIHSIHDDIIAISTLIIAAFTITLWRATDRQGRITDGVLKLAREEFIATHRPSVVIRHLFFLELDGRTDIKLLFNFYNKGATIAAIEEVKFYMSISKKDNIDMIWPHITMTTPDLPIVIDAGYDENGRADVSDNFGKWLREEIPEGWEAMLRVRPRIGEVASRTGEAS